MGLYLNSEAPSFNHCCSGKAIRIAYHERVFVVLGDQQAMRIRHIVVCRLPGPTVFFVS